jgi:glutathione S-transferase
MMKLRWSPTSPFVRKVMMVVFECGLADAVSLETTNAWSPDTDLPRDNPLGKVPALSVGDGTTLYDSPVIAEYLDTLHDGPRLFPPNGPARWKALRLQALGDGLCDAAVLRRLEDQRPDGQRSLAWSERQAQAMRRACDALEAEAATLGDQPTIGTLAVVAALAYLDLRFDGDQWRHGRPDLTAWFARACRRDSFIHTQAPGT